MTIGKVYATLKAMTKLIDGNILAAEMLNESRACVGNMEHSVALAIVTPKDTANSAFIRMKIRAAKDIGAEVEVFTYDEAISITKFEKMLNEIARGSRFDGVVMQLPLPAHLDENRYGLLRIIPEEKDIDCLSERWLGRLMSGRTTLATKRGVFSMLPPVVFAVKTILDSESIDVRGKRAVVIGWGDLVGKPISVWLLSKGATVIVATSTEKDIGGLLNRADIIVAGAGNPGIIRGDMIKEGSVVIDAGTSTINGAVRGDVDTESVIGKASVFAASPGGIGPITVASLLRNVVLAAQARRGERINQ